MFIMGIASTLIGLVPGAATIGSWGAVILVLLRMLQGIAVGGEWGGAALMALEHSEKAGAVSLHHLQCWCTNRGRTRNLCSGYVCRCLTCRCFYGLGLACAVPAVLRTAHCGHGCPLENFESPIFLAALAKEKQDQDKPKINYRSSGAPPPQGIDSDHAGRCFRFRLASPTINVLRQLRH